MNEKYYNSLNTANNKEQTLYGQLQSVFTDAISTSKNDSNLMVNEYISAQDKRRKCQKSCEGIKNSPSCTSVQDFIYMNTKTGKNWNYTPGKSIGHDQSAVKCKSSCSNLGGIGKPASSNWCVCKKCKHSPNGLAPTLGMMAKIGSMSTRATPKEAVIDTVNSCKAGCELEWSGILNLDKGETVGRYYTYNKKKNDINSCRDLSKYAPKVKLGGKCDASEECETNSCVTTGGKCALNKWEKSNIKGRCGLAGVRVDGGNWAWGGTNISLCKKDVEKLGLARWADIEQYIIYSGHWIRVENYGLKTIGEISNQKLENGLYIQDFQTALKAAKAYGERCKGFVKTSKGFILQDSGIGVSKPSWSGLKSELGLLNNTHVIKEGFTADAGNNKRIVQDKSQADVWGKIGGAGAGYDVTSKEYNGPTFPIAKFKKAMTKTCPKGWKNNNAGTCAIWNNDIKQIQQSKNYNSEKYGWKGSSYGCNKAGANHYRTDCADVPDKSYTCWKKPHETVKRGEPMCKTIKGRNIAQCYSEGGRPREFKCPTAAKIIVWVGKPRYDFNRDNIIPMLQEVEAIFPDVRIVDKKEMDNIVAKNIAICACGWYRKDVFSGTTWRTANNSWNGPGLKHISLGNGYPSNHNTQGGCGGGKKEIITCSQNPNAWNRGKGGVFITFSGTQEFSLQQLKGIGLNPLLVESQQVMTKLLNEQVMTKKNDGQVWGLGNRNVSGGAKAASQFSLGVKHANGNGVDQSYTKSRKLWTKAAVQGNENSINALKRLDGIEGKTASTVNSTLEGDMIKACNSNKRISEENGVSLGRTGDYLIKQRKKMLKSASTLERNADAAVNAISQMQGEQLQISPQALSQNQNLLSKLANYQKAKSTLLKGRGELETLRGVLQDNELKKKSNDIMYYVWLTLAISILVMAIRKIK